MARLHNGKLCYWRRKVKMETRKWEEELAGRWGEISALVAGASAGQAGEDGNQLSVISKQKEQRGNGGTRKPKAKS